MTVSSKTISDTHEGYFDESNDMLLATGNVKIENCNGL